MQPLATDVRLMRRLYVDGTEDGGVGDAVASYKDGGLYRLCFFPAPQVMTPNELGVSVADSRMTVKAPYCRDFRPGDRLADSDGTPQWEVLSVTDYPGHQSMEVCPL